MLFDGLIRSALRDPVLDPAIGLAPKPDCKPPKLGLVLGGGAARGWSHIGVIRVLEREGFKPDIIAGCSIGAVVGGCYAAGKLDELERFARALTKRRVVGLLDFHIRAPGLIAGERLSDLLRLDLGETRIEDLPTEFGAVATELGSGHEIWLTQGSLVDALRASYALPGIFDPVKIAGRWLLDGALVNPVPVTIARAFAADLVLCVNLNADVRLGGGTVIQAQREVRTDEIVAQVAGPPEARRFFGRASVVAKPVEKPPGMPGVTGVMIDAFNIMQDRISRSRLAGDPPDLVVTPKTSSIGLFEFHRAQEAIELGEEAAERILPDLRAALKVTKLSRQEGHAVAM